MGSTRLPGKVLADVGGKPLLALLLDRLKPLTVDHLVIATSDLPQDDPVVDVAQGAGVAVVRGSESDVLARFGRALDSYPGDAVIRLTGDCPLTDPAIVEHVLEVHDREGADYTSNTLQRTYPDGLDVEVVRSAALRDAITEAEHPDEREHVTPFIYRRPDRFTLATACSGSQLGTERWTIDTPDDLGWLRSVVTRLDDPATASWEDVLSVTGIHRPAAALQPECTDGRLAARTWVGTLGGEPVRVTVTVEAPGRGIARYDGPDDGRRDALAAVRDLLKGDRQIDNLEETP